MQKLKEFYQYKRDLKKNNKVYQPKLLMKPQYSFDSTLKKNDVKPFSEGCLGLIHLKSSFSNTVVTLTNLKGKVICVKSCGSLGFIGKKKRGTKLALESTLDAVLTKAVEQGMINIFLLLNGFAKGRFQVINSVKKHNIKVMGIRDVTPNPHNGCRPRKLRRG